MVTHIEELNDFADLIESKKIKPNTVRIIRHSGKKFENLDNKIYWYYKNDPKKYHNITREQAENAFGDQKYLAVFVSTNLGETLFTNFYEIGKQEKRGDGETTYELSELDIFKEFEGKLKIDWKSDRNWNQIAGNTPKRILSTGRLTSLDELVPGKEYVRKDLHKAFGGNQQKGIVTLPNHNAIFLLNSLKGINYGYEDGWEEGYYSLSGEGVEGDQKLTQGNKALVDSIQDSRRIFLFEPIENRGPNTHRFDSELKCFHYKDEEGEDEKGEKRKMYRFYFKSINHPEYASPYKKTFEEMEEETEEEHIKGSGTSLNERNLGTESIETKARKAARRHQKENAMVERFINLLNSNGATAKHTNSVDIDVSYQKDRWFIEAKILSRKTVGAYAIGQVMWYNFKEKSIANHIGVLFDKKPDNELIDFIQQFNITIFWEEKNSFQCLGEKTLPI